VATDFGHYRLRWTGTEAHREYRDAWRRDEQDPA
jgi:hypothetical protein